MGRPEIQFEEKDIEQIKVLARCHCPDSEIAAFLGIGETTLKNHFGPLLKEQREAGKANIRAMQYKQAMNGNTAMLIWVGKQILGQREKTDIQLEAIPQHVFIEEAKRRLDAGKG